MTDTQDTPAAQGESRPCSVADVHAPHVWVQPDRNYPTWCWGSDADAAALDVALYGNAYLLDGKRVPPQDVLVVQADCCTPELAKLYVCNQDGLVEAVAKLLDGALHLEDCYITPDETTCVCLIGKLRALLPLCNEPRVQDGKTRDTFWRCVRHIHPSTPDAHVFGQV